MSALSITPVQQQRRVSIATFVGSAVEWYDFFIYGTAAALVLNRLYFPEFDPVIGTLLAFVTFAVGWLARPLGGVIAGHYGDRIGRKKMLVITMMAMGISTFAVGLLPTYAQIGVSASILLLIARVIQGLAVGGEYGGSVVMALENAPKGKRGLWASMPQAGIPAGLVLGTGAFFLISGLPEDQFLAWGWRAPFLLSAVLVIVGLIVRLRIVESDTFEEKAKSGTVERVPVLGVLKHYKGRTILLMLAHVAPNSFFYLCATFVVAYATSRVGFENSEVLGAVAVAAAIEMFTIPLFAGMSDRLGRRKLYITGLVLLALLSFPFFLLVDTGQWILLVLALVLVLSLAHAMVFGPQASFFSELFPTNMRYSGLSLGYQLAGALFGGPLPAIGTALVAALGGMPWLFVGYLILAAIVSIVAAAFMPENTSDDIDLLTKDVPVVNASNVPR